MPVLSAGVPGYTAGPEGGSLESTADRMKSMSQASVAYHVVRILVLHSLGCTADTGPPDWLMPIKVAKVWSSGCSLSRGRLVWKERRSS